MKCIRYSHNHLYSRHLVVMGHSSSLWCNEKMPGATSAMPAMTMGVWFLSISPSESVVSPLLSSHYVLSFFVSPAVPLAPTELGLNSLSSTSADIRWDRVSSSYPPVHVRPHPLLMNIHDPPLLQTYHVEYRLNLDSRPWVEHNVPSNPNSFKITSKYIL